MWKQAVIGAAALSSVATGDVYLETFFDADMPCVSIDADPGFALEVVDGRLLATKGADSPFGGATAATGFSFDGDFVAEVVASRDELGQNGALGLLVLFGNGHYCNVYFKGNTQLGASNSFDFRTYAVANDSAAGILRVRRVADTVAFEFQAEGATTTIGAATLAPGSAGAEGFLFLSHHLLSPGAFEGAFDDWTISAALSGAGCYCPADFSCDGRLDLFDFLAFQSEVGDGTLAADVNNDGQVNAFDFLFFQTLYGAGC